MMTDVLLQELLTLGFGTALSIGLPAVLVGIAWKLVHLWR